jgi:hypothetical protein
MRADKDSAFPVSKSRERDCPESPPFVGFFNLDFLFNIKQNIQLSTGFYDAELSSGGIFRPISVTDGRPAAEHV